MIALTDSLIVCLSGWYCCQQFQIYFSVIVGLNHWGIKLVNLIKWHECESAKLKKKILHINKLCQIMSHWNMTNVTTVYSLFFRSGWNVSNKTTSLVSLIWAELKLIGSSLLVTCSHSMIFRKSYDPSPFILFIWMTGFVGFIKSFVFSIIQFYSDSEIYLKNFERIFKKISSVLKKKYIIAIGPGINLIVIFWKILIFPVNIASIERLSNITTWLHNHANMSVQLP